MASRLKCFQLFLDALEFSFKCLAFFFRCPGLLLCHLSKEIRLCGGQLMQLVFR